MNFFFVEKIDVAIIELESFSSRAAISGNGNVNGIEAD